MDPNVSKYHEMQLQPSGLMPISQVEEACKMDAGYCTGFLHMCPGKEKYDTWYLLSNKFDKSKLEASKCGTDTYIIGPSPGPSSSSSPGPSPVTVTKPSPIPYSSMPGCTTLKDCFSDYEWKTWGETDSCVECKNGKCFNNIKIDKCFSPASSIQWTPDGRPDPSIPVQIACRAQWGEQANMCSSLDEYDKCNNTQFVSHCKDKNGNILGTHGYSCMSQCKLQTGPGGIYTNDCEELMGPSCESVKPCSQTLRDPRCAPN